MDSETFLGPSVASCPGVDNPLTALGMFSDFSGSDGDGTERVSDVEMEEGRVRRRIVFTKCRHDVVLYRHSTLVFLARIYPVRFILAWPRVTISLD